MDVKPPAVIRVSGVRVSGSADASHVDHTTLVRNAVGEVMAAATDSRDYNADVLRARIAERVARALRERSRQR